MKILYCIDSLTRGGAETLLFLLCRELKKREPYFEIHIATLNGDGPLLEEFLSIGVVYHPLRTVDMKFHLRWYTVWKLIRMIKPDIIHTHLLYADRYGLPAAFFGCVKKRFSTNHNMEPNREIQDRITRSITNSFANKIIAVSKAAKEFSVQNRMCSLPKIVVINNAVDIDRNLFIPKVFCQENRPFIITAIGRLCLQKNQSVMIETMSFLNMKKLDREVELRIYGIGEDRDKLEKMIQELGLKNVKLMGVVPNNEIKNELSTTDLFISTSLFEGLPLTVIEAMSCGIPVLISDIPPHRELLGDENHASQSLVRINTPQQIAEQIEQLLILPALYNKCAQHAYTRSAEFTLDVFVMKHMCLYGAWKSFPL